MIGAGKQAGNAAWYQAQRLTTPHPIPIYGIPVQTRELFGVLHLKGFVIDDFVLYSGASLNNVYLHKQDKYRHDRYHVINSAELADCLVNYIGHDLLSSPAVHRLDTPDCPTTRCAAQGNQRVPQATDALTLWPDTGNGRRIDAGGDPDQGLGRNNPLNRIILDLLASARRKWSYSHLTSIFRIRLRGKSIA